MRIFLGVASVYQYMSAAWYITDLKHPAKPWRVVNLYLVLTSRDAAYLPFVVEPTIL
jgi:hypothetical protein